MDHPIYLDNLATTPVDPRVLEAMLPFFTDRFGNAASVTHEFGWSAAEAVNVARAEVAAAVGAASAREIVFTSGGTESNNLAIKGVVDHLGRPKCHVVTCGTEHKSVLDSCSRLESQGIRVTLLPVDPEGRIDLCELDNAVGDDTVLISVMAANNEIGTVHRLQELGDFAKSKGILWHCDAVQAVGKIPLNVEELGIDLLSLSAHKIYGPKGAGALYVRSKRPRARLQAQIEGGGQESGRRSGTLNVPGVVGLGKACAIADAAREEEGVRLTGLRQRLSDGLSARLHGVQFNGHPSERLPGNLSVTFAGVPGADLITSLRGIALSTGSACSSGEERSHVLDAVGLDPELAASTLRFGLGRFNTEQEIDCVIERVVEEVRRLTSLAQDVGRGRQTGLPAVDLGTEEFAKTRRSVPEPDIGT